MLETQPMPPRMFTLEGTFLRFLGKTPYKPKSILLEVEQEQIPIKLCKELRATLRSHLHPGDRITCIGRSRIDLEAQCVELKAYQIFSIPHGSGKDSLPISDVPVALSSTTHPSSLESKHPPTSSKPTQAKILVCQKSSCQKRGGRQLVAVLEQILREHQLQDQVVIQYSSCQKRCSKAPSLTIMPGKHRYDQLSLNSLSALIEEHFCTP